MNHTSANSHTAGYVGMRPGSRNDIPQSHRQILWIDGVGGYLMMQRADVLIGQSGSMVDISIVGDISRQAAVIRLRPVLMTSIATVAGHTPLIFASGAGAEARNSIGVVLVFGIAIGTFFTLFVLPSVYVLLAKDHHLDREKLAELEQGAV